jgi:hypothetical protein
MLRLIAVGILSVGLLAGVLVLYEAGSAMATNDPTVPANECSNNPTSVGKPNPPSGGHSPVEGGSPNVLNDVAGPIQAPASVFNAADSAPGQADGAQGQGEAQATTTGNCLNAGP